MVGFIAHWTPVAMHRVCGGGVWCLVVDLVKLSRTVDSNLEIFFKTEARPCERPTTFERAKKLVGTSRIYNITQLIRASNPHAWSNRRTPANGTSPTYDAQYFMPVGISHSPVAKQFW